MALSTTPVNYFKENHILTKYYTFALYVKLDYFLIILDEKIASQISSFIRAIYSATIHLKNSSHPYQVYNFTITKMFKPSATK
jgi:hypothetical protein